MQPLNLESTTPSSAPLRTAVVTSGGRGVGAATARRFASAGVTVNAVCPDFPATAMTEKALDRIVSATRRSRESAVNTLSERNPRRRLIDPDEVAVAVMFLCSDAARDMNGEVLVIDGGELRR